MSELASSASMIRTQAGIFDSIRPSGARLFFLKHAGQTKKFAVVQEISSGWFATFDKDFRDQMKVSVASVSDISDIIASSSFVAYGIGAAGGEIDVFSFDDKKDSTRPNATSPSWKVHAARAPQERFTVPE